MPDGTLPTTNLHPLAALPPVPSLPFVGAVPWLHLREGFMAKLVELAERYRHVGAIRVPLRGGREPFLVGNVSLG